MALSKAVMTKLAGTVFAALLAAATGLQAGALQDAYSPALLDVDVPPVIGVQSCTYREPLSLLGKASVPASMTTEHGEMAQVVEDLGTIVYATFARNQYGFDLYAVDVSSEDDGAAERVSGEERLTDGTSINFNGAFSRYALFKSSRKLLGLSVVKAVAALQVWLAGKCKRPVLRGQ